MIDHLVERDFAFVDRLWRAWSPDYRLLWPPAQAVQTLRGGAPARPIAMPVLYLHGASDGCIGYASGDGQEIYFTGPYERVIIERAGHFLQLEAPDMVASFIVDWSQELSGHP